MINTLSIVRRLAKSGINREQAEAFADVVKDTLADSVNQQNASLATKDFVHDENKVLLGEISDLRGDVSDLRGEVSDLRGEVSDLRGDMNTTASDLRSVISAVETRLVYWIVGTGLAVIGILIIAGGLP